MPCRLCYKSAVTCKNLFIMPVLDLQQALLSGPRTARELASALGVSQPTVSRLLARHAHEVVAIGKARAARYALRRSVRDIGSAWPVFRVNAVGEVSSAGELLAIYPAWFVWRDALSGKDSVYEGLPWFLADNRPQGYLGRALIAGIDEGWFPDRLDDWGNDDILTSLLIFGELPGNFLVGNQLAEHYQNECALLQREVSPTKLCTRSELRPVYSVLVREAQSRSQSGSSAGGDQPKLTLMARLGASRIEEYLVKFGPDHAVVSGQRWSDLLVSESIAHQVLADQGIPSAESEIVIQDSRTFLEVIRFDRTPTFGRLGLVSLEAVNNEYIGHPPYWDQLAHALLEQRRISHDDYERILRIYAFGHLIANTDMHNGNLSFFLGDDFSLKLAPVYDMLPMHYAPNTHGEVIERAPRIPRPTSLTRPVWPEVCEWARDYWRRIQEDSRVSEDFRRIAQAQRDAINPEA